MTQWTYVIMAYVLGIGGSIGLIAMERRHISILAEEDLAAFQ